MSLERKGLIHSLVIWMALLAAAVAGSLASGALLGASVWSEVVRLLPWLLAAKLAVFASCGVARGVWRYASIADLLHVLRASVLSTIFVGLIYFATQVERALPLTLLELWVGFSLLSALRVCGRIWRELRRPGAERRVVVVGAGDAGEAVVRELLRLGSHNLSPVGFVDDDPGKLGRRIHGVVVRGSCSALPQVVRDCDAEIILFAINNASATRREELLELAQSTGLPVKRIPGLDELLSGTRIHDLRDVTLHDLLGRPAVETDDLPVRRLLADRRVLVTGAAGSIGSELCRQILSHDPSRLVLVDINENALFELEHELQIDCGDCELLPVLCSVRDRSKLRLVFEQCRPDVVFHAAAYKHVPVLEHFPEEAVRNNVLGTQIVAELAHDFAVERFVLISTDKAVRPTSIMGTTKRIAELITAELDLHSETRYTTIRFGNVLGSNGSVLQLFRRQIARGGPVTVTHPEIQRYFMTIPEAVGLVLFAAAMDREGSTFVLDMGEQVRILDMARHFIRMCGLEPDVDIPIEIVGLRPGEKLFEELWTQSEAPEATDHPSILRAPRGLRPSDALQHNVEDLLRWAQPHTRAELVRALRKLVPDYVAEPICLSKQDDPAIDLARAAEQLLREVGAAAKIAHAPLAGEGVTALR